MKTDLRATIHHRTLLARDGFMTQAVDRVTTGMRPAFDCILLPQPKIRHTQWDHGDTTSRALLAWLYVREITGDNQAGREVEDGLWRHLQSVLHPQTGLAYVPEHSDPAHDQYYYHLWDQGRALTYLTARLQQPWVAETEKQHVLTLIRRLQHGLRQLATPATLPDGTTALWWASDLFWNGSTTLPGNRDFGDQNWSGWCIVSSQIIEPQAVLARVTGDPNDLELAMLAARGFLAGFEERRRSTKPMFGPDGHFRGHFHSAVSGLLGIVKLARLLWSRGETQLASDWIELTLRAYRWIFNPQDNVNPGTTCGYFTETAADEPHSCSELCCAADMIELAAELAQCAGLQPRWSWLSDLWDDVERFTRNEVFKMQFTRMEAILPHLAQPDAAARACLDRLRGTWGSCRSFLHDAGMYPGREGVQLNMPQTATLAADDTPLLTSGGCCAYSGIRALYTMWKQAVIYREGDTTVHIVSEHEDANGTLTPVAEGDLQFAAQRDHDLRIRRPVRVAVESVRLENSIPHEWSDDRRWITLRLRRGDHGNIFWPQPEWETREMVGPVNRLGVIPGLGREERLTCTLHYRGNELTAIEPEAIKLSYLDGL